MRVVKRRLILALGAAAALIAVAALIPNRAAVLRADEAATGDTVQAGRILSLGGDVTEILYDLGHANKIIAVDSTSQFPARAYLLGFAREPPRPRGI